MPNKYGFVIYENKCYDYVGDRWIEIPRHEAARRWMDAQTGGSET